MKTYVIGAGGVGSWLAPALCMLTDPKDVVLVDGDKLEPKNLNRQLFTKADIGRNKAEALAFRYGCGFVSAYFSIGSIELYQDDWLMVAVDNHPARLAALRDTDMNRCRAIFGANETYSSESYYYEPSYKDSARDPRVFMPEVLTSTAGDPHAARIGCTGEAAAENPQLVTANMMAASLMSHLYSFWRFAAPKLDIDVLGVVPWRYCANQTRLENIIN